MDTMEVMSMRRGTTPTIKITTNTDLRDADEVWLTIKNGTGELTIAKKDLTIDEAAITARLTQQQTLAFASGRLSIQLRALFGSDAIASPIVYANIDDILKDGEIVAAN